MSHHRAYILLLMITFVGGCMADTEGEACPQTGYGSYKIRVEDLDGFCFGDEVAEGITVFSKGDTVDTETEGASCQGRAYRDEKQCAVVYDEFKCDNYDEFGTFLSTSVWDGKLDIESETTMSGEIYVSIKFGDGDTCSSLFDIQYEKQ